MVKDSRQDKARIRRRRWCIKCDNKFSTFEEVIGVPNVVVDRVKNHIALWLEAKDKPVLAKVVRQMEVE